MDSCDALLWKKHVILNVLMKDLSWRFSRFENQFAVNEMLRSTSA
jgi:hypothetical protein